MTSFVVGAFEHPTRLASDKSTAMLHAEVAAGALADAGLNLSDIDGYFCAGDAPGVGPLSMVEYLGINPRFVDSSEIGGSSPIVHLQKAALAIDAGLCNVALITQAGRPRAEGDLPESAVRNANVPENGFELPYGLFLAASYALATKRHMEPPQSNSPGSKSPSHNTPNTIPMLGCKRQSLWKRSLLRL